MADYSKDYGGVRKEKGEKALTLQSMAKERRVLRFIILIKGFSLLKYSNLYGRH